MFFTKIVFISSVQDETHVRKEKKKKKDNVGALGELQGVSAIWDGAAQFGDQCGVQSAQSALKEGSNWKQPNDSISFIGEWSRMIRTAVRGIPTFLQPNNFLAALKHTGNRSQF